MSLCWLQVFHLQCYGEGEGGTYEDAGMRKEQPCYLRRIWAYEISFLVRNPELG